MNLKKVEKWINIIGGMVILVLTYVLLYYSDVEYIKSIVPILAAVAGWMICIALKENSQQYDQYEDPIEENGDVEDMEQAHLSTTENYIPDEEYAEEEEMQ
jgi:hypothetical protein